MKYQSIYFSPTGTTKAVVEAIAQEVFETGQNHDLSLPGARKELPVIDPESVLIVGAPVYSGRIPFLFEETLKELSLNQQKVILVAVYGNCKYHDALIEMKDLFEEKGCTVVAAGAFLGVHSFSEKIAAGRPDQQDIEKAKQFAREIIGSDQKRGVLEVAGNRPYRERKPASAVGASTSDKCIQCKACANNCPVGAINLEDCRIVDELKCITCNKCVKVCPVGAKYFDERMDGIVKWLEDNCMEPRKEPEWFI
jgi:ferredoxin